MANIEACPDVFAPLEPLAEVVSLPADPCRFEDVIPEYDAYFASLEVPVTRAILDKASRLHVITTPSTGTDHIDMDAAREKGIEVLTLKEERVFLDKVTATAEMAWTLLLAVVRRLPWSFTAAQNGEWARDRFRGHQLAGMTLGILGHGRLGAILADYGLAFRMMVLACDVMPVEVKPGVSLVEFETLLREADVLSIHIHLTEKTRNLINAVALAKMKPGAILINTSRGAIVDESALIESLARGQLGGYATDVIDGEWDRNLRDHPLIAYSRTHENVVISPHTGGCTYESQSMAFRFMVRKLKNYLEKSPGPTL